MAQIPEIIGHFIHGAQYYRDLRRPGFYLHVIKRLTPKVKFCISILISKGGTPVKKYHSAVPLENSAFKNFIHTCLMLNSENTSNIRCKISHLLQSIAIVRHVSAQITMPKRTISHRRLLFVHYHLLKSGPF